MTALSGLISLLTFQECFSLILPQNSVYCNVLYVYLCYDFFLVVLKNGEKVKYQSVTY